MTDTSISMITNAARYKWLLRLALLVTSYAATTLPRFASVLSATLKTRCLLTMSNTEGGSPSVLSRKFTVHIEAVRLRFVKGLQVVFRGCVGTVTCAPPLKLSPYGHAR